MRGSSDALQAAQGESIRSPFISRRAISKQSYWPKRAVSLDRAHLLTVILDDLHVSGDLVGLLDVLFHYRLLFIGRKLVGRDLCCAARDKYQSRLMRE